MLGKCAVVGYEDMRAAARSAATAAPSWVRRDRETCFLLGPTFRARLIHARQRLRRLLISEGCPGRIADWQLNTLTRLFDAESCSFYRELGRTEIALESGHGFLQYQPDGVVCVDPPANAPCFSTTMAVLYSLMAGNGVVVRIPRSAPLSTTLLLREIVVPALRELGGPDELVNFCCASPGEALRAWLDEPCVNDIFYQGGSEKGLRLQAECLKRGKKALLELSGNDTVLVWHDADVERVADTLCEAFWASGQLCIAPNKAVVHPRALPSLTRALIPRMRRMRPGYPEDEETVLTPVPAEHSRTDRAEAPEEDGEVLVGGERLDVTGAPDPHGTFLEPTITRVNGLDRASCLSTVREETFRPLLVLAIPHDNDEAEMLEEMIGFVNDNSYGLRNSVWTRSRSVAERFVRGVHNGALIKVNRSHINFTPFLPTHGGTGLSCGVYGEAHYLVLKTCHLQAVEMDEELRTHT
nr:aldehyde dehydrogenase family protein [Actinopolyspora biskrensis]